MTLEDPQRGIVTDWTQHITASKEYFAHHSAHGFCLDQRVSGRTWDSPTFFASWSADLASSSASA